MNYQQILDLINTNLASGKRILAINHREVEVALLNYINQNLAQSGDVKRVKCDLAYLQSNFEVDGLGKNLRLGWAICNGNNGTDNLAGRVGIGYGSGFSILGAVGGSSDSVVTAHTHDVTVGNVNNGQSGGDLGNRVGRWDSGSGTLLSGTTTSVGVSGIDKNMQPYIVNLYIMKL